MASTSSSFKATYDVFLSFRGGDTRHKFTRYLYEALCKENIQTFIDDGLNRGEEIDSSLMKAIEESKISVIVFSIGYASSPYCLDELVKILQCRESMSRIALPIFYEVDPTDVEKQTGFFGDQFRKLETDYKQSMEKWRNALKEAASLSGWDSKNYRPETDLIKLIVKEIMKIIFPTAAYSISKDLVGIEPQIEQILQLLWNGSTDVRVVGLWGMGGIGKTTIAEALSSRISDQFDGFCFLSCVREESSKLGLIHLRRILFSKLLGDENLSIDMLNALPRSVANKLTGRKVLLVLDDVNDSDQLMALAGNLGCFGAGTKIIVTSRDEEVLRNIVDAIYKVQELNYNDACQLLNMKAFKGKQPNENIYTTLLERAVNYARGIPLALEVLGSHLCQRPPEQWEIFLSKLEQSPDPKIQNILKISYDELEKELKDIFLDVAVFFKKWRRNRVEDILKCCGVKAFSWGIIRLQEKCLLTIVDGDALDMHDLIQEMGREIAQQEGSRLVDPVDICRTLANNTGKNKKKLIQGIFLDITRMRKVVYLHPQAFSRMRNLRLLKIFRPMDEQKNKKPVFVLQSDESKYLQSLPNMLSLFHWEEYPYKYLPAKFSMENVVELCMPRSNIKRLWHGDKFPENLKSLNLSECRQLKKIPNLFSATSLEEILLDDCESLVEIHSSIKGLQNLARLNVSGCKKLKILPEVPRSLQWLQLNDSGVEEWSPSIQFIDELHVLDMRNCINITSLPINFHLNNGVISGKLLLDGCLNLHTLPDIRGNLQEIHLSETAIKELPSSIGYLSSIIQLKIEGCKSLEVLPDSIRELKILEMLNLSGCSKLSKLPPLNGLSTLKNLYLGGTALKEITNGIGICELKSLEILDLGGCSELQKLPHLHGLSSLQKLNLSWTALKEIPEEIGICELKSLRKLSLKNCSSFEKLPPLYGLSSLQKLNLSFTAIEEIPNEIGICELKSLRKLLLKGCSKLRKLPSLHGWSSLEYLCLDETVLEEIPRDIVSLPSLRQLTLINCNTLRGLPKLPQQLEQLNVQNCTSLRTVEPTSYIVSREYFYYEFNYCNCPNLDEDARSIILSAAETSLKEIAISDWECYGSLIVGIPECEIPEWYGYQSQGSSISIDKFPASSSSLGFAFSVVVEFNSEYHHSLHFDCEFLLKYDTGEKSDKYFSCKMEFFDVPDKDHLFIFYDHYNCSCDSNVNEASFEFKASVMNNEHYLETLKVKRCGVHLIYGKEELDNNSSRCREMKEKNYHLDAGYTFPYFVEQPNNTVANNERSGENMEEESFAASGESDGEVSLMKVIPYPQVYRRYTHGHKRKHEDSEDHCRDQAL